MWLADTTFIIDLVNSDKGAVDKAKTIDHIQTTVFISTVTVEEYLRGIYFLFHEDSDLLDRKLIKAEGDLARFRYLDLNYQIAKLAAKIDADLTRTGKQIGYADVLIAATARFYDLKLLTRNVKHYTNIHQLGVEKY